MTSDASFARSLLSTPLSSAINSTFPCTVRHFKSVASWKTYPRCSRSTDTVPVVCVVRPEAMRSNVDLPQPDGPTTVTNSPARTEKSASLMAIVPSGNVIDTCSKTMAGGPGAATVGAPRADPVVVLNASPSHRRRSWPDRCSSRNQSKPGTVPCGTRRTAQRGDRGETSRPSLPPSRRCEWRRPFR